jgi:hypothetical protein
MNGFRVFKSIFLFYMKRSPDNIGFGIYASRTEYDSEHYCTRDLIVLLWNIELVLWLEDTK